MIEIFLKLRVGELSLTGERILRRVSIVKLASIDNNRNSGLTLCQLGKTTMSLSSGHRALLVPLRVLRRLVLLDLRLSNHLSRILQLCQGLQ